MPKPVSPAAPDRRRGLPFLDLLSGRAVLLVALAMIAVQAGFRGWAMWGGWFQLDDTNFQVLADTKSPADYFLDSYNGHLMPGGMAVTYVFQMVAPFNWAYPVAFTTTLQVLASIGLLVLLVSAFGPRWGILAPLAIYLTSAISVPGQMWWAAAINQMPFQVVLFWGTWTFLNYLRTRRTRWLIATLLITTLGLIMWQKVIFVFVVYAFLALAYFAEGDLVDRVGQVWSRYRAAVISSAVLGTAYLAAYVRFGLNFDPGEANADDTPLTEVLTAMIGRYVVGITGGPLRWNEVPLTFFTMADPTDLQYIVAFVVFGFVVYEITRTRIKGRRALILPLAFLLANGILVASGRSTFAGFLIATDYRYQTELPAVTAITLGLALFGLRGAPEQVIRSHPSTLLDRPRIAAVCVVAVGALGVHSSMAHIRHFQDAQYVHDWMTAAHASLNALEEPVDLLDGPVPGYVLSVFNPEQGVLSAFMSRWDDVTRYPDLAFDNLSTFDSQGRIVPVAIDPIRRGVPASRDRSCPFPVKNGQVAIKLDGPVVGAGFWTHIEYGSTGPTPIRLTVGENTYEADAPGGLHSMLVRSNGEFDTITIRGIDADVTFCVTSATLGLPMAATDLAAQREAEEALEGNNTEDSTQKSDPDESTQ